MARYWLEGKLAGQGVANLVAAFTIFRNAVTGGAPAVAAPALVKVDDANCPGLWYFDYEATEPIYLEVDMDPTAVGPLVGVDRFLSRVLEPSDGNLDTFSPHFRLKAPTFNAAGRLLTADLVYYPSASDAVADTNALRTVSIVATYGGDGRIASYVAQGS